MRTGTEVAGRGEMPAEAMWKEEEEEELIREELRLARIRKALRS